MSTTDPPAGGRDPVSELAPGRPGDPRPDESHRGDPDPVAVRRGYEEDKYDAKSVISVPILVLGFFAAAFLVVTIMFRFMFPTPDDPEAHPQAVERNSPSLNERMGRITRGGEVDQPRLE